MTIPAIKDLSISPRTEQQPLPVTQPNQVQVSAESPVTNPVLENQAPTGSFQRDYTVPLTVQMIAPGPLAPKNIQTTDAELRDMSRSTRYLTVVDAAALTPKGLAQLGRLTELVRVTLDLTNFTDQHFQALFSALSGSASVQELWVKGSVFYVPLGPKITTAGLTPLSGLTGLTRLRMQGVNFVDSPIPFLPDSVQHLSLAFSEGVATVDNLKQLDRLQKLESLDLTYCHLIDEQVKTIVKASPSLRALVVGPLAFIGKQGVQDIAASKLTSLTLHLNKLDPELMDLLKASGFKDEVGDDRHFVRSLPS